MNSEQNNKIKILNNFTVSIKNEGHTLLNALRWSINNKCNTEADFSGYTIPHPSEKIAHFTIQFATEKLQNPTNLMKTISKGCENLEKIADKLLQEVNEQ